MRTLNAYVNVLRDGVKVTTLNPIDPPTIMMNNSSKIKGSMSGKFMANDIVDWAKDELQPVAEINGEERALGVFLPATITEINDENGRSVKVDAYDRCWKCESTATTRMISFQEGLKYTAAVIELLAECGVENNIVVPSEYTLTTTRADWDIGTSYLDIINQLLDEINYKPVWFDNNGFAIIEPEEMATADNIVRTYDAGKSENMMLPTISAKTDYYNAPNKIIAICSNSDLAGVLTATAENRSDFSPFSINRRGRTITEVYRVNNIASQEALEDYARLLIQETMMQGETVTIKTAIRTDCGVDDVVAVVHPEISGICIETGWTMELKTGGTMEHTLSKVVSFD